MSAAASAGRAAVRLWALAHRTTSAKVMEPEAARRRASCLRTVAGVAHSRGAPSVISVAVPSYAGLVPLEDMALAPSVRERRSVNWYGRAAIMTGRMGVGPGFSPAGHDCNLGRPGWLQPGIASSRTEAELPCSASCVRVPAGGRNGRNALFISPAAVRAGGSGARPSVPRHAWHCFQQDRGRRVQGRGAPTVGWPGCLDRESGAATPRPCRAWSPRRRPACGRGPRG